MCDCYGTALANVEHNENGLLWALDNWMHTSEGDTYLRLKDGKFETRQTLSRGQWGATQDDFGHVYRNSNSSALHIDLVSTPYFARNPNLLAHARQLRVHGRSRRAECDVSDPTESGRQSRLRRRPAACRRHARHVTRP